MTQKILIAVDDSENAARAVEFVARHFSKENQVTLLNVMLDTAAYARWTALSDPPFQIPTNKLLLSGG